MTLGVKIECCRPEIGQNKETAQMVIKIILSRTAQKKCALLT